MKVISLMIPLFLISLMTYSQSGKVFDQLTINSKILDTERSYAVYLPPNYDSSEVSYPVLYLLHGSGNDHTGWVKYGKVLKITDKAIKTGKSAPMIIVMPDAKTGKKGYFNDISDKWNYEDFFFKELIPEIEKNFRVKSEKQFRAIAGLSMGGGGTFMYALHRPKMFASACPLSAYIGPSKLDAYKKTASLFGIEKDEETIERYFHEHNALSLVKRRRAKVIKSVRWLIDCGDNDFLLQDNYQVHLAMEKKKIPHEYIVREGEHNWKFWRESLPKVLQFVSVTFQ